MEELEALRKRLNSLQKETGAQKLSERNCIEIMMKLIELKMIDVIYTLNGREYITHKHLESEIQDEILKSGGRVNISDLQPLLNVDLKFIQDALKSIMKKDKSVQIHFSEIMTKYYLDSVVVEIDESLQEAGKLSINDLAVKFSLDVDFLSEIIRSRLGKLIHAIYDEDDSLYTQSHVNRHKHKVMGLFSSVTQPVIISQISKQYNLNDKLIFNQIQDLVKEKRLAGSVQGKGSSTEYIPTIFLQSRSKWIDSFFNSNFYISYETLSKIQISDPQSYLKTNIKDGIPLATCFINKILIDKVDDSIIDIIENIGWLDVTPLLPSPLTNKDIEMVVNLCPSMLDKENSKAVLLNNYFIVSSTFIDRCFLLLKKNIQEKLEKQNLAAIQVTPTQNASDPNNNNTTTTTTTTTNDQKKKKISNKLQDSDDEQDKMPTKSGKKSKSSSGGKKSSKFDSDDEQDKMPTKQSNKKQTKKSNNKKRGDSDSDNEEYSIATSGKGKKQQDNKSKPVDHYQDILQLLKKWYDNMEEELIDALSIYLRPKINKVWEELVKEAKEKVDIETMKSRKAIQQTLITKFQSLYNDLVIYKKGLDEVDPSSTLIHKHMLKQICTVIVNLLVELNANYHLLETTTFETPQQRSQIISSFPSQTSKAFEKIVQLLNKQSVDDFIESLNTVANISQLKLKPLDKKGEKIRIQEQLVELQEQLKEEDDVGNQFQFIVLIYFIKYINLSALVPSRSISLLITKLLELKDSEDYENFQKLHQIQQEVIKLIVSKSNQDSDENLIQSEEDKLKTKIKPLIEKVLQF